MTCPSSPLTWWAARAAAASALPLPTPAQPPWTARCHRFMSKLPSACTGHLSILNQDHQRDMTRRLSFLAQSDRCVTACEWRRMLQEKFGLQNNRTVPEWGQAIFSDMCVIVRPENPDELARFIQYCIALHQTHLILSQRAYPVTQYKCGPCMFLVSAAAVPECAQSWRIRQIQPPAIHFLPCMKSSGHSY